MKDQKEICVLSTLLLHSSGVALNEDNLRKISKHLKVEVDSYLLELFSKVSSETLDRLIKNPSAGSVSAPSASAEVKEEAKKEEEPEEESEDFDLF
ncbi:large subunit ribosomal protein LP1 [Nematocida sp. LUAm3]|nr:large subunit ribosomal protein LP1 [Nematocida sp. LUAm3]KAI5176102.1 large subunit ribosomal protein LP1 [Nematocida sp. LUAm2]KAI5178990.1 large subunit ribosomal protein LP1 [Nematocida sp. LUAm1]